MRIKIAKREGKDVDFEALKKEIDEAPLNWSLEDKIYQLIMIDFNDDELELVTSYPWGGVILFDKNINTAQGVSQLNYKILRNSPFPPFIAVDQEGGTVFRIDFPSYPAPPSQMAVGNIQDMYAAKITANINGRLLRALGFNMVFAPVLDVNTNPYNPIINTRAFGDNPLKVALYGKYAILGYREAGIIPVGKHFPGHGSTSTDSHLTLPVVDKSFDKLWKEDIFPFKEAIEKANLSAVMSAHVLYPAVDKDYPATMSKRILTDILREKLNFKKVVFTDALNMKALKDFDFEEVLITSLNAGSDQLLVLSDDSSIKEEAVKIILKAVKRGFISEERINEAVFRIIELKRKNFLNLPEIDLEDESLQESVNFLRYIIEHTIKILPEGKVNFSPDTVLILLTRAQEDYKIHEPLLNWLFKLNWSQNVKVVIVPSWGEREPSPFSEELIKELANQRALVAYYLRHRLDGEILEGFQNLIKALKDYIFLDFANPYIEADLPKQPLLRAFSYGYNRLSQEVVLEKLEGVLV